MSGEKQQFTFFTLWNATSHLFPWENFLECFTHPITLFSRFMECNPSFSPRLKVSIVNIITFALGLLRCAEFCPCSECVWHLQDYPPIWWFSRKIHRAQHIALLVAVTYYSERTQSTISRGKRHMGWSPEETRHEMPLGTILWATSCDNKCEMKLIRDSAPRVFTWGLVI